MSRDVTKDDKLRFAQTLVEAAPTLFYVYDLEERRNIYIGPQITPMFGYSAEELQAYGDSLFDDLFHSEDLARIADHHDGISTGRTRDSFEIEYRMRHKDGRWIWLLSRETVYLRSQDGRVKQILGTAQDVTARKQAEEALRESELRASANAAELASLYDTAPVGLCVFDRDLRFLRINERLAEINGIPASAHIGKTVREIVPDLADTAERIAEEIFRTGEPVLNMEFSGTTRAGPSEIRHWVEQWVPLKDHNGAVTGLSVVADEITDRKTAEMTLRDSEARYRALVDLLPAAMYTCDAEGRITLFNQQAVTAWGRAPRIGDFDERFCGSFRLWRTDGTPLPHAETPMAVALRTGASFRGEEVRIEREDGSHIIVAVNIDPIRDATGQVIGAVNLFVEITERKIAEERLRDRNKQLDLLGRTSQRLLVDAGSETELLRDIFSDISELINVESFYHYRPIEPRLLGLAIAAGVSDEERRLFATMQFGELLCGRVAETRSRLVVENLQHCTQPGAEILRQAGATSYAGFPLVTEDKLIGTIAFVSRNLTRFRDGEIQTIQLICDQIATTLERRRLQRELREAETRQRLILDNTLAFVGILDRDGTLLDANAPALTQGGLTRDDVIGRRFWECDWWSYDPRVSARLKDAIAKAATGEIVRYDAVVRMAGDTRRTVDVMLSPLRDPDGNVVGLIPSGLDITERKRAEQSLRESEARFRATFENAAVGIALVGLDGSWLRVNDQLCAITGYSAEELLTKTFQEITHPDDLDADLAMYCKVLAGETENYSLEKRYIRSNGEIIWVELTVGCSREADGTLGYFISVIEDIGARKEAEATLRAAHDTFRHLVERSPFGIYVVDADFRLVQVSEGAQKVFQNVRPLIGRDFADVLRTIWPEPFASDTIERFRRTLETGAPFQAERTVEARADIAATEAYDWRIERIVLPDGRPGVVCHFYDLSERQRHEDHVRLLMREVNHRSKNLLGLVLAIARQSAVGSGDFVQRFEDRLQSLAAAQDLLVKAEWKAVPLADLIRSQLSHFADLIDTRIQLAGPALYVMPDSAQALGMALHELATNAAKYGALSNEDGRIDITWDLHQNGSSEPEFTISWVEKGGPPVAEPRRRGFGSTVTTNMVGMSTNGHVALDYAPSGLSWCLTCPPGAVLERGSRSVEPRRPHATTPNPQRSRRSVLIIEDEPLIALEMTSVLVDAGFDVIGPVGTVRHALDLLGDGRCDVVVLDVHLGDETSERVARELTDGGIKFVVVSGYSRDQIPEVFQAAPLLVKPVQPSALANQVESLCK